MPGRSILLFAFLLPILILRDSAASQSTPEATPAPECTFQPVSVELLREIERDVAEHPIPTPTQPDPSDHGFWTIQVHVRPFPPPAGEPLDDATLASLREFLSDYTQCLIE